ncbi:hypothetical protein BH23PAT2_BH23PAT2_03690 [soil metagenome]
MDSIQSLLKSKKPREPKEIQIIKAFVSAQFASPCGVAIREPNIIITVDNAALAGSLQMQLHALKKACQTDKRLVIRISSVSA